MKKLWIGIAIVGSCMAAAAADWKPAPTPLTTRWGAAVDPAQVLPEYPRPQFVRQDWQNLNGLWEFAVASPEDAPPFGKTLERKILVPFPVESSLSGVGEKATEVWYRRLVNVDPWRAAGRRVILHFGAVDWETQVWVNGQRIGEHRGGYDAFHFDITSALKPSGEQEIVVKAWDPSDQGFQPCGKQAVKPEGIWYTSTTGIWQTVWLEPVAPVHIAKLDLTPDVDNSRLLIRGVVAGLTTPGLLAVVARDPGNGGKVVGGARIAVDPASPIAEGEIKLENPRLWSPDDPHLYDLEVTLDADVAGVDHANSYFGMRKISLGKDADGLTRLFLNNQELFQFGPLDQGFWPDGLYTAPSDEALRYDLEITKQLGFNMTRKHVKVEPERWYYWADKLGLLVWQDMPSGDSRIGPGMPDVKRVAQSARQFEIELGAMMDNLRNHPSIVHWVVFNEGWGQFDSARMTDWTKARDPSRLVITASGWTDRKTGDIHDIHHYPPPRSPKPGENRAAVNGEYGGLGLPIEDHTWQDKNNWGYQTLGSVEALMDKYADFIDQVRLLRGSPGMSAAVYTQLTDVEIEVNGLLTYDRSMVKGDLYRYRELNLSVHRPPPRLNTILSSAKEDPQKWRFTREEPSGEWNQPGFDDSEWRMGEAGFGTIDAPGSKVRTTWNTKDIWIRRSFDLAELPKGTLGLEIHHDDEAEVFLNGKPIKSLSGWTSDYEFVPLDDEARAALQVGTNLIAVHCRQDAGGQYIDVGLIERIDP